MPRTVHSSNTGAADWSTGLKAFCTQAISVLHGAKQMLAGDIAESDAADQPLVAGSDHDQQQFVEALVGTVMSIGLRLTTAS